MSYFLFATFDGGGNVPAVIGVAASLASRGHRVRVMSQEAQRGVVTAAGLEFEPYQHGAAWDPTASKTTLKGLHQLIRVQTDDGIAHDVVEAVAADPPEVIVVDCMLLSVLARLRREGIENATLFHSLYGWLDRAFRNGPVGLASRVLGTGDPRALWEGSGLQLVCADRQLDPTRRQPRGRIEWVGPVHQVLQPATPQPTPRILVSLSTIVYPGLARTLQKIISSCAGVDAEFVVTTGPAIDPESLRAPANTTVHRYVPHSELMPTCTALIGHGGHSTAMAALAHGIPSLTLPMHPLLDQPAVGRSIANAGAGLTASRHASEARISAAIKKLIATDSYYTAATAIGERLRAHNGAREGASALERLRC